MLYISEKGMRPALKCISFIEEDFSQKVCSFRTLFSGAVATDAERGLLRVYEVLGQPWASPATDPLSSACSI